jgi:hypothetical protein
MGRDGEIKAMVRCVEHYVKVVVRPLAVGFCLGSVHHGGQGMMEGEPVGVLALFIIPRNVGNIVCVVVQAGVELGAAKHGMKLPKPDQFPAEAAYVAMLFQKFPIVPGNLVVLAIRVVVPALSAAKLVSPQDHRRPYGKKKGCEEILNLPIPSGLDLGIVAGALDTEIH